MLPWIVQLGYKAGAAAPVPAPTTPVPTAHGSRRKKRQYVEIDGQAFQVDSAAEAVALLQRARAVAEVQAEDKASIAVRKLRKKEIVPKVLIAQPQISASPEIAREVAPLIADIERLYEKAAINAELRLLLAKQLAADEDEEDVLFLL